MNRKKIDLKTPTSRRRLTPYREPYWEKLPPALLKGVSLGFRRSDITGAETWHARLYLKGTYHKINLGDVNSELEYKDAYRKALEWAQSLKAAGPIAKKSYTLNDVLDEYLKKLQGNSSLRNLDKKKQAEKRLDALVVEELKKRKVNSITAREINVLQRQYQQRKNHGDNLISPESVNRVMTHLIAALNHGYRSGMIDNDDSWKHYQRLPEEPHKRNVHEFVSLTDRQRFIDACPAHLKAFVRAMHYLGARPSEIRRLKVAHVDLTHGWVQLLTYKGKARTRRFPLPENSAVRELFLTQLLGKERKDYVFTTLLGKPWTQANLAKAHKAVRVELGLPKTFDTYSWRHCRISDFVHASFPAPEVAKLTGTSLQFIEHNYYKSDSSLQAQMACL